MPLFLVILTIMLPRFFLLLLLLLTCWSAQAQEEQEDFSFSVGARGEYGFIFPHRQGMRHLIEGHVPAFEVFFERPTFGDQYWQSLYNYPEWGVAFLMVDYNNPDILGRSYSLYPYLNFHLCGSQELELNFKTGLGGGIVEKSFDRLENHKNNAIGSRLNISLTFALAARWVVSEHLFLEPGIAYTHLSNTAVQLPNLGINTPMAQFSAAYRFGDHDREQKKPEPPAFDPQLHFSLYAGGGIKEVHAASNKIYPAYSLLAEAHYPISRKNSLGVGTDLTYNSSLTEVIGDSSLTRAANFTNGVKLCYELTIQRLALLFQAGVYTLKQDPEGDLLYHRFGFRYRFNDRWLFNATLKTHFARADHLEVGLGYRFL